MISHKVFRGFFLIFVKGCIPLFLFFTGMARLEKPRHGLVGSA